MVQGHGATHEEIAEALADAGQPPSQNPGTNIRVDFPPEYVRMDAPLCRARADGRSGVALIPVSLTREGGL